MRPLQALRHSFSHLSPTNQLSHTPSIEPSTQDCQAQIASRHDAQMITGRTLPTDPYKAWLEQREVERERERHTLNPRDAWENLRTQSFCAIGRS